MALVSSRGIVLCSTPGEGLPEDIPVSLTFRSSRAAAIEALAGSISLLAVKMKIPSRKLCGLRSHRREKNCAGCSYWILRRFVFGVEPLVEYPEESLAPEQTPIAG